MPSFTRRVKPTEQAQPSSSKLVAGAGVATTTTDSTASSTTHPTSYRLPTLIHTGIPSLDDLLHLPPSSTFLTFSRDLHSSWPRLIERYFLSQGLLSTSTSSRLGQSDDGTRTSSGTGGAVQGKNDGGHSQEALAVSQDGDQVLILGDEESGRELVRGSMWVDPRSAGASGQSGGEGAESGSEGEGVGGGEEGESGRSRIAWRYAGMSRFKTSAGEKGQLNLGVTIPKAILDQAEASQSLDYISPNDLMTTPSGAPSGSLSGSSSSSSSGSSGSSQAWPGMARVLARVREKVQPRRSGLGGEGTVRIVVNELGGWEWGNPSLAEIHRFLHALRSILRGHNAAAIITLPASLAKSLGDEEVKRLSWAVDACVELKGFADDPSLPALFAPLHGLLTLHSFPFSSALLPSTIKHSSLLGLSTGGGGTENNLGFRARRKRWGVETVHLGVEGGVGERRTGPVEEVLPPVHSHPPASQQPIQSGLHSGSASGPTGQAGDTSEGFESAANPSHGTEGSDGSSGGKAKKPRARVRFGEDDMVAPIPVPRSNVVEVNHEDNSPAGTSDEHGHSHTHNHSHHPAATRPGVRHDRMDLYDF